MQLLTLDEVTTEYCALFEGTVSSLLLNISLLLVNLLSNCILRLKWLTWNGHWWSFAETMTLRSTVTKCKSSSKREYVCPLTSLIDLYTAYTCISHMFSVWTCSNVHTRTCIHRYTPSRVPVCSVQDSPPRLLCSQYSTVVTSSQSRLSNQ